MKWLGPGDRPARKEGREGGREEGMVIMSEINCVSLRRDSVFLPSLPSSLPPSLPPYQSVPRSL